MGVNIATNNGVVMLVMLKRVKNQHTHSSLLTIEKGAGGFVFRVAQMLSGHPLFIRLSGRLCRTTLDKCW